MHATLSAVPGGDLPAAPRRRIFMLGATGTIGRATAHELVGRGHEVVCFVRPGHLATHVPKVRLRAALPEGAALRYGEATDPRSLVNEGLRHERFDVLVSCLASRTGAPADAWSIDYQAHVHALDAAREAGVQHVVLLSALCVQKPRLAFQFAKRAFEQTLIDSGIDYTIVRPTAFFKSLSGQIRRVQQGKPYLLFGNGMLTACKPISDHDLACFLADCLDDPRRRKRVLPIGGPGDAITPRQQAEQLFSLLNRPPRIRSVPVALLSGVIGALGAVGRAVPRIAQKAELARIGRYYATESMLVWDPDTQRYDAGRTPSTGTDTLFDHYARVLQGSVGADLGDHAVF